MVQAAWWHRSLKWNRGRKAYEINRRIKAIFDPERILNPDVIITDDPECV